MATPSYLSAQLWILHLSGPKRSLDLGVDDRPIKYRSLYHQRRRSGGLARYECNRLPMAWSDVLRTRAEPCITYWATMGDAFNRLTILRWMPLLISLISAGDGKSLLCKGDSLIIYTEESLVHRRLSAVDRYLSLLTALYRVKYLRISIDHTAKEMSCRANRSRLERVYLTQRGRDLVQWPCLWPTTTAALLIAVRRALR